MALIELPVSHVSPRLDSCGTTLRLQLSGKH